MPRFVIPTSGPQTFLWWTRNIEKDNSLELRYELIRHGTGVSLFKLGMGEAC